MLDDGNCMFRSLSDATHGHQKYHSDIRNQICVEMRNNRELYEERVDHVIADERKSHVTNYEEYMEELAKDRTWGGKVEIDAFVRAKRVCVMLYMPN